MTPEEQHDYMAHLTAAAAWDWAGIMFTRRDADKAWRALYDAPLPDDAWAIICRSPTWKMIQWNMRTIGLEATTTACQLAHDHLTENMT